MSKPRILVVDIETMAGKGYFWRTRDENISLDQIIAPPRIICWAAKFVGDSELHQSDERDGRVQMLVKLKKLVLSADAVVSYNGDRFDLPKINGELMMNELEPLPPVTSIDLIKTVRKLGLVSNRLEFFAKTANIGRKIKTEGFQLWRACDEGNKGAWERMLAYNAGDVRLTESAYKVLRPFVRNHPYMGTKGTRHSCPACSSTRTQARGVRRTRAFLIQRLQCLGCGGWFDGSRETVK